MKPFIVIMCCGMLIMFSMTKCTKTTQTIHDTVTLHKIDTVTIHKTDTLNKIDTLYHGDTLTITLTSQPGPDEGQNTLVTSDLYATFNLNSNPDINVGTWTYGTQGGGTGVARTYLKFIALDGMPDSATIISAKLSLYGISVGTAAPQGNSVGIDNSVWIQRLTTDWNPDSVSWNSRPTSVELNEASIPASTTIWNNDALNIDVTALVNDLLNNNNYGFALQGKTEEIYRSMSFASCKVADPTKRPKLVVVYEIYKHHG
ncbi:MAG TPA: DNRLRE domain-containing protein [Puia sp.]